MFSGLLVLSSTYKVKSNSFYTSYTIRDVDPCVCAQSCLSFLVIWKFQNEGGSMSHMDVLNTKKT